MGSWWLCLEAASRLEPQLEVGATDNSEDAQESQPGQCGFNLHYFTNFISLFYSFIDLKSNFQFWL